MSIYGLNFTSESMSDVVSYKPKTILLNGFTNRQDMGTIIPLINLTNGIPLKYFGYPVTINLFWNLQ